MKKLFVLLLFGLSFISANATTTLVVNLGTIIGGTPSGAILKVALQNCTNARVIGSGYIVPQTQQFTADSSGNVNMVLYDNVNQIDCSGQKISYYSFTATYQGNNTSLGSFRLSPGTFNLSQITACVAGTCIPPISPNGDNTYLRLDGGNSGSANFSGLPFVRTTPGAGVSQTITQADAAHPLTVNFLAATNLTSTTAVAQSTNGTFNEELFAGATVANRVNAAITACGTNPCYIVIPPYAPTGVGWSVPNSNISIEDQRFYNGTGFALNGNPDFHFYHQYLVNAKGLQSWETLPGTLNSGPWGLDIEAVADGTLPQPAAHDGVIGNVGGLIIFAQRNGGNRALWGQNINVQYSNFNNVVNGLEIDLGNNSGADDPGDGSAGIALQLIGGTNTSMRSGVGLLIGNVASQTNSGFITAIGVNAYKNLGINLASSSTKLADISIALPDADPTKTAISVSSSTIANAQFHVFDDGSVIAQNIRGQNVRVIGAPVAALQGEQVAFNQAGAQEMDLVNYHSSGPVGGLYIYSAINGAAPGTQIFKVDSTGVSWGGTGSLISDSAVVAQMGIATVGQVACIKASNPRTVGYCSGTIPAGSACTCN